MGQGLSVGCVSGFVTTICLNTVTFDFFTHGAVWAGMTAAGVGVDFISDAFARQGKVVVDRPVILNAADTVKCCSSYYTRNDMHPLSKLVGQKHEWVVLQSHGGKYYTVQKEPKTGNVSIFMANSTRAANDIGLRAAGRPIMSGEIKQHRGDCEFDLPDDLQLAYVIAWLKKEDPRWAFSTENSKQFCLRLRTALNDF